MQKLIGGWSEWINEYMIHRWCYSYWMWSSSIGWSLMGSVALRLCMRGGWRWCLSCWMRCSSAGWNLIWSASIRLCMREGRVVGDGAAAAGWLLDAIQQRRLEPNVTSLDAVMHARREGSGRWCWSCRMRCSSACWNLIWSASMRLCMRGGWAMEMVLQLLDEVQQRRLKSKWSAWWWLCMRGGWAVGMVLG